MRRKRLQGLVFSMTTFVLLILFTGSVCFAGQLSQVQADVGAEEGEVASVESSTLNLTAGEKILRSGLAKEGQPDEEHFLVSRVAGDNADGNSQGTLLDGTERGDPASPPISLVTTGATWKYQDNGSDQGVAWRTSEFDDSTWSSGPAQLGYGDGDEALVIGYGNDLNNKYITTYFRHTFTVVDAAAFTNLTLRLQRDDGAVVYLNGVEAARQNMPAGTVSYTTLASTAVGSADESTFFESGLNPALLIEGTNILAVEVHQCATTSTDVSFDLELVGVRPTMTIALNEPADAAANVSSPPTLSATVSHQLGTTMTAVVYGRIAPPPGGPDFTLVALPDTQKYTAGLNGGTPAMMQAQADWIVTNRKARNIVFAAQLGDCTQNGDGSLTQWQQAISALYRLEDPLTTSLTEGVPYGVAVGNHDQYPGGDPTGTTIYYNQYFGAGHFGGRSYYGGNFGTNNDNHYALFSASGLDFIVIFMEYDLAPDQPVLDWANGLLQTHSARRGIVVSHSILNVGSPATFTTQGTAIYDALKANPNLFLLLCGHNSGEARREDVFNNHTVHSLLADYQSRPNGGSGWMRLLEFSPNNNIIRVRTFTPYYDGWETDADSQFDLPYNMEVGGEPLTVLGTCEKLPSGSVISHSWPGLTPSTTYEWYVTVSDGTETASSVRRRFTTAPSNNSTIHRLFWAHSSGQVSIWRVDASDNRVGYSNYGPFSDWTAKLYRRNAEGTGRLIWTHTSGHVSIWTMDAWDNRIKSTNFGPYSGWTPIAYDEKVDGTGRLIWAHTSGQVSIWSMDAADNRVKSTNYGPYSGWAPKLYHINADGTGRLIWAHTSGQVSIWSMDAVDNRVKSTNYGPFSGWTVLAYDENADGTGRLTWTNTSGQVSIWSMDAVDNRVKSTNYGPYSGWTAKLYHSNADGSGRLLWKHTSGEVSHWSLDSSETRVKSSNYGPFEGWTPIAYE